MFATSPAYMTRDVAKTIVAAAYGHFGRPEFSGAREIVPRLATPASGTTPMPRTLSDAQKKSPPDACNSSNSKYGSGVKSCTKRGPTKSAAGDAKPLAESRFFGGLV